MNNEITTPTYSNNSCLNTKIKIGGNKTSTELVLVGYFDSKYSLISKDPALMMRIESDIQRAIERDNIQSREIKNITYEKEKCERTEKYIHGVFMTVVRDI